MSRCPQCLGSLDRSFRIGPLAKQAFDQRLSAQAEVLSHIAKDAGQRANAESRVTWDGHVVFASVESGQPNLAARLACHPATEAAQGLAKSSPETSRGSLTR